MALKWAMDISQPLPPSSLPNTVLKRPALVFHHGARKNFSAAPEFNLLRFGFAFILIGFCLTGCQSPESATPVKGAETDAVKVRYVQVSHAAHGLFSGSQPPRISLDYRNSTGVNVIVWPSLASDQVVIKDDLAIMVGERGFVVDGAKVTRPRLLAVKVPRLPLDLTDEILLRWARLHHQDFGRALSNFTMITPETTNDGVVLHLEFWASDLLLANRDWPEKSDLDLTWAEVDGLLHLVSIRGHEEKDLRWHTAFIEETLNRR